LPDVKTVYWDAVGRAQQHSYSNQLWRAYSDAVNTAFFARWLPERQVDCLLKTDLFDEALSDGLYPYLACRARSVVGIDLSMATVQAAGSRYAELRAIAADVRCLPFADNKFDMIISNSTLDHFESRGEILVSLRELNRVLRSGGKLFLTLDNLANPIVALRNVLPFRLLNRMGLVPYYVGQTVGPRGLLRVLRQAGFDTQDVVALMHSPRVIAVAMARLFEKYAATETQRRFLRFMLGFEHLSRWSTRFVTGYYVAARADKR